ncbi:uncharacterized protein LOC132723592 [Ruditapes philippinarum]|uniref:uncharacterized protein LOC132723592 n=1 Tax=Ruditapes philippinarum TaxID=129788 RepID=UPI00295AB35D|nr:uncharacterized protein LOC132723592 [Ruditapes philippinarum]
MATCSSEEAYDYNCTPCTQQERFVEAKRFCVECGEYFCSTCLAHHEKFGLTKGHTLVKCEEVSKESVPTCLSKCDLHTDKEEDMVCGDHDVVCCRVCLAKDHKSCQDIGYLPDVASTFKEEGGLEILDEDLKSRMKTLKLSYEKHAIHGAQLRMRKKTNIRRLKVFKESITELIETAVTEAEEDIENSLEPHICSTQKLTEAAKEELLKLSILSEDLINENNAMLEYKKALHCKRALREIQSNNDDCKMTHDNKYVDKVVKTLSSFLTDQCSFGAIKVSSTDTEFDIPNMCVLEGGYVCIADYHGRKIKLLDNDLNEDMTYDTRCLIWGVCAIDKHMIAFTMPSLMTVEMVEFTKNPVFKSSFSAKFHCRGIAFFENNLYMAGGGFLKEEPGQINIFDIEGNHLTKFEMKSNGNRFCAPRSLTVNTNNIFVTDCQKNSVVCLDFDGVWKWILKTTRFTFPWGICLTTNGNLLISGRGSDNIVVVSKNGEFLGEILNKDDNISTPQAIAIDNENSRLLVFGSKKPYLEIFNSNFCEI